MGLFDLTSDVGCWLGEKIENAGDALGIEIISDFGSGMQDFFSGNIGNEQSYDKQSSSVSVTERLDDQLVSFTKEYEKKADELEKQIIKKMEKYYDELIDRVETLSDYSTGKAEVKSLKRNKGKIQEYILGAIKIPLSKRMSLDDAECLKILKMEKGSEKKKAMSTFCKKVITEAIDNLSNKVHESIEEQIEDIQEYLNNIVEKNEREFLNLKEVYEKICADEDSHKNEKEKYCVLPLVVLKEVDMVETIL